MVPGSILSIHQDRAYSELGKEVRIIRNHEEESGSQVVMEILTFWEY